MMENMPEETGTRDPYRVLHIQSDAPQVVVKAAFRALASLYHPDVNAFSDADRRMAELNKAYAQIRTPDLRVAYDTISAKPAPTPKAWAMGAAATPPPRRSMSGDSMVVDFGRYDGWTIADLALHDPDYLRWLTRHTSGHRYRKEIEKYLAAIASNAKPKPQPQPRRGWSRLGI